MTKGIDLIAAERERQLYVEGYSADHDRGHSRQLATAGAVYALPPTSWANASTDRRLDIRLYREGQAKIEIDLVSCLWPWDARHWKPTPDDRIRELTKAGALIAAAIDAELLAHQ